jgi:hypothetical protein
VRKKDQFLFVTHRGNYKNKGNIEVNDLIYNEGNLTKHIDINQNHVDRSYNLDRNIVSVKAYKLDEDAKVNFRRNTDIYTKGNKKIEEVYIRCNEKKHLISVIMMLLITA